MSKLKKSMAFTIAVVCILVSLVVCIVFCIKSGNSGYCGAEGNERNVRWELDELGTLTISGTGEMASYIKTIETSPSNYKITYGNPKWNKRKDAIKKVVIEDGVTSIGKCAFYWCSSIEEIVIPDSVTDIGNVAFGFCSSLKKVNIPENVTVLHIGTFSSCTDLTEIVIPDSVQTIEQRVFSDCKRLTEINIPDSVESIDNEAFAGCEKLEKVTIPETLTEFGKGAFVNTEFLNRYARKNQPLIINNIVVDGSGCTGKVIIPEGATKIGKDAFSSSQYNNETDITSIVLPDSIRTIGESAFAYCENLEEINFPEGLKTIEEHAFTGCKNMPFIVVLPESLEEIHSIGDSVMGLVVLNPDLDVSFFQTLFTETRKIYCPRNSKAHKYAEENGYKFMLLEEMDYPDEFIISNIDELE